MVTIIRRDEGESEAELNVKLGGLCRGWISNRMFPILGMMQFVHPRYVKIKTRARLFFDDLERHFIETDRPRPIQNAFRYLKLYLLAYPNVSIKHSCKAIEMVRRIYHTLGLKLDQTFKPALSTEEKLRRVVCKCNSDLKAGEVELRKAEQPPHA